MNLSEMRQVLASRGIQLTKSLGQNFLFDHNQLKKIIAAAELSSESKVLEIGPGLGPLTELIAKEAGEVLAIEKDGRLVEFLNERFTAEWAERGPSLRVLHADALEYLRKQEGRNWAGWKLVSNLPYSVASPILVELAQAQSPPDRIVATLQAEVAHRLIAQPDSSDYGILSLLLQVKYEPGGLFKIPASCFFPAPDVDSACVTLNLRRTQLVADQELQIFETLVKLAFSQRRKMMLKLLKSRWEEGQLARAFQEAGIDAASRAESVSLDKFVRLTKSLTPNSGDGRHL